MKNIILLSIFTLIAIYIGFFAFDKNELFFIYSNSVYYFISVIFFIWFYLAVMLFIKNKKKFLVFISNHKLPLIVSSSIVILFLFICPPEYRILADEVNLLGTSKSLFEKHNVFFSLEEINMLENKQHIAFSMDKRLVLFPYVLNLVHSLKGYSTNNAFIINFFASIGCLFLLYYFIQRLWGKYYGLIALLFLASYPLFIRYSMSAGYDVFCLFCAFLSFVFFCRFCKFNSFQNANLLIYSVALLSYTRYECSVMAIIIMIATLIMINKKELDKIHYSFCIYPLLFVPNAWIMFFANTNTYLQVTQGERVFALDYLPGNISDAFYFFLEFDSNQESVLIIALLAIFSIFFLVRKLLTSKNEIITIINKYKYHLFILSSFLFIQIIIKFSYKYGDLLIDQNARFGMTCLPYIIFLAVYFIKCILQKRINYKPIVLLLVIFTLLQYWAKTQNNFYAKGSTSSYKIFKNFQEFLEGNFKDKNDLILASDYSNFLTPLKYNSISIETLNKNFSTIKTYIEEKKYWNKLIVIQVLENGKYEKESVVNGSKDFEVIYEKAITDNSTIRYSVYKSLKQ